MREGIDESKRNAGCFASVEEWCENASAKERFDATVWARDLALRLLTDRIERSGYIETITKFSAKGDCCEEDSSYVYMWRHMFGAPFYIGSGKGNRWLAVHSRSERFARELAKGDAVVYKLVEHIDAKTAAHYERMVSLWLTVFGITLANRDNNAEYEGKEKATRWLTENGAWPRSTGFARCAEDALLTCVAHCEYKANAVEAMHRACKNADKSER